MILYKNALRMSQELVQVITMNENETVKEFSSIEV